MIIKTIGLSEHYPQVAKKVTNKAGKEIIQMPLTSENIESVKTME